MALILILLLLTIIGSILVNKGLVPVPLGIHFSPKICLILKSLFRHIEAGVMAKIMNLLILCKPKRERGRMLYLKWIEI